MFMYMGGGETMMDTLFVYVIAPIATGMTITLFNRWLDNRDKKR